jgi:transcription antitermination factor NusG
MWTKTITTKFKKQTCQVQIWLDDSDDKGKEVVKIQSMFNEYYLVETILFNDRDSAYDFIKHYPKSMATAFLFREIYANCLSEPF